MRRVALSEFLRWVSRRWGWVLFGAAISAGVAIALARRGGELRRRGAGGRADVPEARTEELRDARAEEEERALRSEQLACARKLVETYPKSDDAVHLLGLVYREQGNMEEAVKCWRKALELDPSRADSCVFLALDALIREEFEEAESLYRRALAIDPRTPGAVTGLAKAHLNEDKPEEAAALLSSLQVPDPDALILLGEARRKLGDFAQAAKAFEGALRARPEDTDALYGLGMSLERLGEKEKSREVLEAFKKLRATRREEARVWRAAFDPKSETAESVAHTHTDVGRVYRAHGSDQRSEELWRRAAALDPGNVVARLELSTLYAEKGREAEATKVLEDLRQTSPSNPEVFFRLGILYARSGRRAEALRALGRGMELAPQDPRIRRAYADVEAMGARPR